MGLQSPTNLSEKDFGTLVHENPHENGKQERAMSEVRRMSPLLEKQVGFDMIREENVQPSRLLFPVYNLPPRTWAKLRGWKLQERNATYLL